LQGRTDQNHLLQTRPHRTHHRSRRRY